MTAKLRMRLAIVGLAGFVVLFTGAASAITTTDPPFLAAAKGTLKPAQITANGITKTMPFFSDGPVATAREALDNGERKEQADAVSSTPSSTDTTSSVTNDEVGLAPISWGCGRRDRNSQANGTTGTGASGNQRVNQDCSFRRQAEEDIIFNPADPTNLLAGQNDSSLGYNQCGIDYSIDNGQRWGSLIPPFRQRDNDPTSMAQGPNRNTVAGGPPSLHTYDAGSDPTMAFDSQGRGYFSCIVFNVNDFANGIYVTQSPKGAKGSFFFNVPPSPAKDFMVVEDNNTSIIHDKQFIVADTYATSPNKDNVYITWTVFFTVGGQLSGQSPIYGSMSTDHGHTWSTAKEISGFSLSLCPFPATAPGFCNADQGSDPIVLPNGDLVVAFYNANTPTVGVNQILAVRCHPSGSSTAGTADLNCEQAPRRVGTVDEADAPVCSFGRECIPGAFIRTNPFPRIAVNTVNGNLYITWQDHARRDNPAVREWSIQLSRSTDGGMTWSQERTVNPDIGLDHYEPAIDIAEVNGTDRVGVSYYRTEEPTDTSGEAEAVTTCGPLGTEICDSDYVLAGGLSLLTPYVFKVVSVVFPPPDGIQAGFNGDYSGLTINKGTEAHPIWSDTRNRDPFRPANGVDHDEDIYTQNVGLPNGQATNSPGQIGK
jgi:hypothetical protein